MDMHSYVYIYTRNFPLASDCFCFVDSYIYVHIGGTAASSMCLGVCMCVAASRGECLSGVRVAARGGECGDVCECAPHR